MLPRPGCADIFPARSSVSGADARSVDEVPGAGRVDDKDVRASIGRLGVRRDIERYCRAADFLCDY